MRRIEKSIKELEKLERHTIVRTNQVVLGTDEIKDISQKSVSDPRNIHL